MKSSITVKLSRAMKLPIIVKLSNIMKLPIIVKLSIAAALFCCAASVCVEAQGARPSWVDDPSAVYPGAEFASAVGGGADRAAAEANAFAALVAYFRQTVSGAVTIHDSERQVNGRSVASSSTMSQTVEASAALDALIGAEIKAVWRDTRRRTGWWAVAVMEKAQGRERYAAELTKTIHEINRLIDSTGGVSFDTIAQCRAARELLPAAELYALVLAMLDGPARQSEVTALAPRVEAALGKARDIPVDVRVTGDSGGRFKAAFTRPFTANGFRTGNRNSRYALVVNVTLEAAPRHQYYNTRYVVDAVLRDTQSGAELFTYNAADREAHPASQADADNRALIGALNAVEEAFPAVLEDFLARR